MNRRFLVIIPAFNEEQNLPGVLQGLLGIGIAADILVVNDGSLDKTAHVAARYPVNVISHPYNLGYGAALQTGYKYAVEKGYDFVLQFDADGQHNPADLPLIMAELEKGDADILMGSRYLEGGTTFRSSPMKKLAVRFFRRLIRVLTGVKITDPTTGLRGVSRNVFEYYAVRDRFPADFPDADILIQMILRKYRIREVPANMRIREAGESMHAGLKPVFYMMKILLAIFVVMLQYKMMKRVSYRD